MITEKHFSQVAWQWKSWFVVGYPHSLSKEPLGSALPLAGYVASGNLIEHCHFQIPIFYLWNGNPPTNSKVFVQIRMYLWSTWQLSGQKSVLEVTFKATFRWQAPMAFPVFSDSTSCFLHLHSQSTLWTSDPACPIMIPHLYPPAWLSAGSLSKD